MKLEYGPHYLPKDYLLKTSVNGKEGSIHAEFSPRQVMFNVSAGGAIRRSGLLLGTEFTLLDTNMFHHYIFLSRLFESEDREKAKGFEVVIPQEQDDGQLILTAMGKETISVKGKMKEARRIKVDSGSVQIYLWVDGNGVLHRDRRSRQGHRGIAHTVNSPRRSPLLGVDEIGWKHAPIGR